MSSTEKKMPISGHFGEMRKRFFHSVIAIVIFTAIAFIFWKDIYEILLFPAPEGFKLQAIEMMETLSNVFKVCLTTGLIISMPYLVYQLFAFLSPALTSKEKRYIFTAVPFIGILFLGGVLFAYFVALPPAISFLTSFGADVVETIPRVKDYINIVTRLLLVVGITFETPLILMVLSAIGIVTPEWLAAKRKIWFVLAFVVAAMVTPTMDPITQTSIAAPLIVLYELSIWLTRIVRKRKKAKS